MYVEFISRNLNEYHKIYKVFDSATTPEHFEVAKAMVTQFANNCDKRKELLTERACKQLRFLMIRKALRCWYERNMYHESTLIQIQDLVDLSNEWAAQYEQWLSDNKVKEEETEKQKKAKIDITGFQSLNKVTKAKKTRSKKKGAK